MPGPYQNRYDPTNPPKDVLGIPGVSYPTPVIADLVIVRTVPLPVAGYTPLAYGTPDETYPSATLIDQKKAKGDNNALLVVRTYATNPQNQQLYDAAISYTAESTSHAIYMRSSLELRSTYAPLAALTPDPVDSSALCTKESAEKAEDPWGNLYVRVTQVFENMGSQAQQDAWNATITYPYISNSYPRTERKYRFPATAVPTLTIGSSTDTVTGGILIDKTLSNESSRVTAIVATFDPLPAYSDQTGLGVSVTYPYGNPSYPVVTWKYRVAKGSYTPFAGHAACPVPGYSTLVLTDQGEEPDPQAPEVLIVTIEYEILPGCLVTSTENTRISRFLSLIPAKFLGDDTLTTTVQVVDPNPSVTQPDAISDVILSSIVKAINTLKGTKTNVTRPGGPFPVLTGGEMSNTAGGQSAVVTDAVILLSDPTMAYPDPAIAETGFGVIASTSEAIDALYNEIRTVAVESYPTLNEAQDEALPIPARFLAGVGTTTTIDTVDTTSTPAVPATGAGVLKSTVRPKEGNKYEALVTTESLAGSAVVGGTTFNDLGFSTDAGALPILDGVDQIAKDADGGAVTEYEQTILAGSAAAAAVPSPLPFQMLGYKDQPLGNGLLLRTARKANGDSFPVLTRIAMFDPELQVLMRETQQIIDATTVPTYANPYTVGTAGSVTEFHPLDALRSIQIVRELLIPLAITIPYTYGTAGFHRPLLISNAYAFGTGYLITGDQARNYVASTRTTRTFGSGPGFLPDAETPPIVGGYIDFSAAHIEDFLCDSDLTLTSGSDSYAYPATNPTVTGYLAEVAAAAWTRIFKSEVRDYHYGLMLKETVAIQLQ
jgi:hypothetical protein